MPPFLFNYLSDPRTNQQSFLTQTSTMASSTERPQPVCITLTPKDDPTDKRTIILNLNRPVTIGRSSRSEPKNLAAGTNNALFDNPVVSRKHAQLELKMTPLGVYGKEVTLTDVGSMHGTWVNGTKLDTQASTLLKSGDKIKFGDRVVRNYDAHDGLAVLVEITDAPSTNAGSKAKPFTGSYKVPSDSEYDSDDMGSDYSLNDDEENTSSAHTTPEQASAKPGSQQSPIDVEETTHASIREVIDLASDDGLADSKQPSKSRLKPNTTIIQDSYKDPSLRVADSYGVPQRSVFRPWQSRTEVDVEAARERVASVMKHNTGLTAILGPDVEDEEDEEDHSDDDIANDDVDSAGGSILAEIDGFYDEQSDDQSDALDERDDDDLSASDASDIADIGSVSDDEGPEVFSSKRQISPELGTLGQTDTAAAEAFTYSTQPNNTAKLHYDPVRGSAPPSPTHAATASNGASAIQSARPRAYASFPSSFPEFGATATNFDDSSRWDVGPMASQYYSIPNPEPFGYHTMYDAPLKPSAIQPNSLPFGYMPPATSRQVAMPKFGQPFVPHQDIPAKPASKLDIMNLVEDRAARIQERIAPTGTKRKVEEMAEMAQPEPASAPSVLSPLKEPSTEQAASLTSETVPELVQQEASTMELDQPHAPVEAAAQEPPKKKTKRSNMSIKISFPTKEIAKAAGYMALGGAATISFLVSDAAQKLLS